MERGNGWNGINEGETMDKHTYSWTAINWTSAQRLEINAVDSTENKAVGAALVKMSQASGSMYFQFAMTPAQAWETAMALIAAAESLA